MALGPRLEFRQAQSLALTPQLMQSIRLLQLSHLELNDFVEAELLRNPLLERIEAEPAAGPSEPVETADALGSDFTQPLESVVQLPSAEAIAESFDTAVENVFPEQPGLEGQGTAGGRDGAVDWNDAPDLDQFISARPRLSEHLERQANLILRTAPDRLIAQALIGQLDEAGYLTAPLESTAEQLGTELADVVAVLEALQGCEPLGVFARGLAECLTIQLREADRLDPMMAALLANLPLLADHNLAALQRAIGCDREDLLDMMAELRRLDPRPGLAFDSGPAETVIPDVFVRPGPDGGWAIELNSEVLPRVLVDRVYYATVSKGTREPGDKTFLSDCFASANWLAKSLDQRAQTIVKTATEIVRQQDGFLRHGIAHLRPMTLKMVAEAIEMHESTVSRVTANKYLATPRGMFEMKYFFTTAIAASDGGSDHSAEAVRHRIRQLIDSESPRDILSDDTIAALLKREQGIELARRTVAKYREGMNIPSSVIRRRQKRDVATLA